MPVIIKKCKFYTKKTNFVKFIIKLEQISIDLKKIKPSQLLTGYLVLFIPKKNRKLRIYINYKQLNNIIKKN